jgi:hypothetical protein
MVKQEKPLYTLIPLDDFKAVMGIDDREDKLARFCLVTAAFSIEQYCKRRMLRRKHFEQLEYTEDLILLLREYPVTKILAVFALPGMGGAGEIVEPEFYRVIPDCGIDEDLPFSLSFSPALKRYRGLSAIKAVYWAGYPAGKAPADLASACLELAAWNMNRYKGRRIGMSRKGENFELSMPANVCKLLEPYKKKVI